MARGHRICACSIKSRAVISAIHIRHWQPDNAPMRCSRAAGQVADHAEPPLGQATESNYCGASRSNGFAAACVSSHRTRVRKASHRLVSLKVFRTEETNHKFKQSRTSVPSSNQWTSTQPIVLPPASAVAASNAVSATRVEPQSEGNRGPDANPARWLTPKNCPGAAAN
jgi:hypothetical protein